MAAPPLAAGLTAWLVLAVLATAACEHSAPGRVEGPGDAGPFTAALPRRMTFYEGDDHTPSVTGSVLVYSRQSDAEPGGYGPAGREQCLAFLPVEGGTIQQLLCPHRLIAQPDSFVDTWFEPAVSPDGSRIAFMWMRSTRIEALGFLDAYLMVNGVDRPQDTTGVRARVGYAEAGVNPRHANIATRVTWVDAGRIRFLATFEHIIKVKGGGAERLDDTLYYPLALMEMDAATGAMHAIPGGDSVVAYATAPDGAIWVARPPDPAALLRLDPATGVRSPVGRFSSEVLDLAAVDGAPVAVVSPVLDPAPTIQVRAVRGGAAVERLDPVAGSLWRVTDFTGPVVRIVPAGGRRFVAEVERVLVPFGVPPDLWLFELP